MGKKMVLKRPVITGICQNCECARECSRCLQVYFHWVQDESDEVPELSSDKEVLDSDESDDDDWDPSLATPAPHGRRTVRRSHSRQSSRPSVRDTHCHRIMCRSRCHAYMGI